MYSYMRINYNFLIAGFYAQADRKVVRTCVPQADGRAISEENSNPQYVEEECFLEV